MAKVSPHSDPGWSVGRNPWCVGFIDWLLKIGMLEIDEIGTAYSILNPFKNWERGKFHKICDVRYYLDRDVYSDYEFSCLREEECDLEAAYAEMWRLLEKMIEIRVLVLLPGGQIALSGCSEIWMYQIINGQSEY